MDWITREFEEDVVSYNFMQLAHWIERCRAVVSKQQYIQKERSNEEYLSDVWGFSQEWEEHYRKNESVYKSVKYKKALAYLQFKDRVSFVIDYGIGAVSFPVSAYENSISIIFKVKRIEDEFKKAWNDYYSRIENIFIADDSKRASELGIDRRTKQPIRQTYKEKIAEIVADQAFCNVEIHIRALKDRKLLNESSYDAFIKTCEQDDKYEIKAETRCKKRSYNAALDALGVTSTTYHQWQSEYECEKDIDKKFFINLCFALALPLSMSEKLLELNGFSIRNSQRQFDIICEKALRIGFSQEMTIALIDKLNEERAKGFMGKKFIPVPNLTKNR